MGVISKVVIVYGGELAKDVAEQIVSQKPKNLDSVVVNIRCGTERPKTLLDLGSDTVVCFCIQTVENAQPAEEAGPCVRFFKRKTHSESLLKDTFASYSVLGLGDSNLLLDRQTTTAKDCNQAAQQLDTRLQALGASPCHPLGMADERTGLNEVDPWIQSFWESIC